MINRQYNRENAIRTDRIAHYEEIMDRIIRVIKLDGITPGVYTSVLPGLKEFGRLLHQPGMAGRLCHG